MRYPLAFNSWDKKEKTAAIRVINSGSYTMGAKSKLLKKILQGNLNLNLL